MPPSCRATNLVSNSAVADRPHIDRRLGHRIRVLGTLPLCSCGFWGRSESSPTAARPSPSLGRWNAECSRRSLPASRTRSRRARSSTCCGRPIRRVAEQGGADHVLRLRTLLGADDPDDRARLPAGRRRRRRCRSFRASLRRGSLVEELAPVRPSPAACRSRTSRDGPLLRLGARARNSIDRRSSTESRRFLTAVSTRISCRSWSRWSVQNRSERSVGACSFA